jgi:hypothetical protein
MKRKENRRKIETRMKRGKKVDDEEEEIKREKRNE